ncbi:hypothetical protein [Brevibacillus choshinensis]|nr:hypothetical protein [Brevibacillus choshinensis]
MKKLNNHIKTAKMAKNGYFSRFCYCLQANILRDIVPYKERK